PENDAKLCNVEKQQDQYDFRVLDSIVDLAEANNMRIHGHVLVWHECLPSWLQSQKYTRDQAIQALRTHINTIMRRYRGRFALWDVVNEAFNSNGSLRASPWRTWIGDDYIELAFRFAHETDPNALLFYNDYGAETLNAKSDAIYAMVSDFVKRGVPINGV